MIRPIPQGHPCRPSIDRVPKEVARPKWSVMIPTFNCAQYLHQTLSSVMVQDPGPESMQIEVVDDCSTLDNPEAIVARLGRGRVSFFRQNHNLGLSANLSTCIARSKGLIVHVLHGDDAVRPGFYAKMQCAFDEHDDIGAAFCREIFIDCDSTWLSINELLQAKSGPLANALECLASEQRIMTPAICVRREVYERLGAFDRRLSGSEDWEMSVRIAAAYPVWYEPEPLALYRMHDHSNRSRNIRTGRNITNESTAIEIISEYLPPARARAIGAHSRSMYALSALRSAERAFATNEYPMAWAQLRGALKLSWNAKVLARAAAAVIRPHIAKVRKANVATPWPK